MSTFLNLQNSLSRECFFQYAASESGKLLEIRSSINQAVAFYENEAFYFNEQQATATTAPEIEYYPAPDDYIQMYSLALMTTDTRWETLEPLSFDEIEQLNRTGLQGRPTSFCTFNQQLRLHPIPNAEYELRLSYLKTLFPSPLIEDTDSNAWTDTRAEPLIRAKAKAILFIDVTHDPEQAMQQEMLAQMWLKRLQKRSIQWFGTEQVRPQVF